MKRTLVVVAAVVGFATAASAATLTVFTTDSSNVVRSTFTVGETILLKVTGDAQGGVDNGIHGELAYNGGITSTVPGGSSQPGYFANQGTLPTSDGLSVAFDSNNGSSIPSAPLVPTGTSIITLVADAIGFSTVTWGGTTLDFFNIYSYNSGGISVPSGFAGFEIVIPEPTTAALVGLGLFGLALGGRRRQA